MTVERIYIGGLDPPRLSGKDIVARLKPLNIEVKTVEDKEKCYIHLTAKSLGDESALSIISQKYNNVKWKGCRLSVAEAKPHFLQRLEMERQEREARNALEKDKVEPKHATFEGASDDNDEEGTNSRIPRRLRIRKKFGDEAVHVDTRPFSVDTWKNFYAAQKKLRKRAENHAQKALKLKEMKHTTYTHAPLEHRALHIRFESSGDGLSRKTRAVSSSENEASEHDESASSDEESSSEESSSTEEAKKTGSYDWSDDDSDGDSASDDVGTADNMAPSPPEQPVAQEDDSENDKPPSSKKEYQWSSDSSSDESSVSVKKTRAFQEVAVDDEFAAGLDDEKWNSSDEEDHVPASEKNAKDAAYQMDNDVSANLGVLAELFPDMKDKSPLNPLAENQDAKHEESKSATKPSMPFGIIPRYDPTAAASQKYELKEEKPMDEESEGSEESEEEVPMKGTENSESEDESKDDGDNEQEAENENEKKAVEKTDNKGHIYEEGKLENVFREARDAWQIQSTQATQKKEESSTGTFSFGFDLGNPEPKSETNTAGGFSFGFDLPPGKPAEEITENEKGSMNADEADGSGDGTMDEDKEDESVLESNMKRRRGLHFSQPEMQSYEADFFAHNSGEQVIEDLDGFRNDQEEREKWLRERQSLTLDWKRKRKLAMSRIQKRVRHG